MPVHPKTGESEAVAAGGQKRGLSQSSCLSKEITNISKSRDKKLREMQGPQLAKSENN